MNQAVKMSETVASARYVAADTHYDEKYFAWQREIGKFGGLAELWKFQRYIKPADKVVDFGCGGGYVLSNLRCGERIGIEINAAARANCEEIGVRAIPDTAGIADGWADVLISNHAIEHVHDPLRTLMELRRKLRPGGIAVVVAPCEAISTAYVPGNQNYHLFTWSPMNLGNLFHAAGYQVLEARSLMHRWMPRAQRVQRILGWPLFHRACWVYGTLFQDLSQVRVTAINPG